MPRRKKAHTHKRQTPRGFTIIEVMIVLAIAGVIMLVVLLAVPALQRNSRNYQRKNFAQRAAAQMESFYQYNRYYPKTPSDYCNFIRNYLANSGDTKSCSTTVGSAPGFCVMGKINGLSVCYHDNNQTLHNYRSTDNDELSIIYGHNCMKPGIVTHDPHDIVLYSTDAHDSDTRKYAIWIMLEKVDKAFCIDNKT